jgi:hypothetical protein
MQFPEDMPADVREYFTKILNEEALKGKGIKIEFINLRPNPVNSDGWVDPRIISDALKQLRPAWKMQVAVHLLADLMEHTAIKATGGDTKDGGFKLKVRLPPVDAFSDDDKQPITVDDVDRVCAFLYERVIKPNHTINKKPEFTPENERDAH